MSVTCHFLTALHQRPKIPRWPTISYVWSLGWGGSQIISPAWKCISSFVLTVSSVSTVYLGICEILVLWLFSWLYQHSLGLFPWMTVCTEACKTVSDIGTLASLLASLCSLLLFDYYLGLWTFLFNSFFFEYCKYLKFGYGSSFKEFQVFLAQRIPFFELSLFLE